MKVTIMKVKRYQEMCGTLLMEEGRYPAKCHRDKNHEGLHRAFVVGGLKPGFWRDGDTRTHEEPERPF